LLKALRASRNIVFTDNPSPGDHANRKSAHLVVCEDGDDLAQVIAANYAFSLRADLCLIPEITDEFSEDLLERFYSLYDSRQMSASETLELLRSELQKLSGNLPIRRGESLTFVTRRLPYGFAFPEVPSTHLFKYPDLGIAVINGFAAEQPSTRGVGVSVLVDPETTDAPEIEAAEKLLRAHHVFVRRYQGPTANVRAVAEMVELFPYDLLIIATHCGDAPGYRWTYEFTDSEGIHRKLVVDIAIGVERTDEAEMLKVTQFLRFISLDGVDWHDPKKSDKLYVGTAMNDFVTRTRPGSADELKPVTKETVERVIGSAVLNMHDQNYIALPRPIANSGTPILINNACSSWHRLAGTFTFCNARAYVGTLFPIGTTEAHDVVVKLLGEHFWKPLPEALWLAQRQVYEDDVRRPYVMTGVYPQRLRVVRHNVLHHISTRLSRSLEQCRSDLHSVDPNDERRKKAITEVIRYYEREVTAFQQRWLRNSPIGGALSTPERDSLPKPQV